MKRLCVKDKKFVFQELHNAMTEQYGIPIWVSYGVFALSTIVVGLLLGMVSTRHIHDIKSTWKHLLSCEKNQTCFDANICHARMSISV